MEMKRESGVLLHPVSLPGSPGIGDIGKSAYNFIDFLEQTGASLWQVLPLGPTGHGNSPYTAVSSFAGNPMLIGLDLLEEQGYLPAGSSSEHPEFPKDRIDYRKVIPWKEKLLRRAALAFLSSSASSPEFSCESGTVSKTNGTETNGTETSETESFGEFCRREAYWLEDYALFTVAKRHFDKKAEDEGVEDSRWNIFWPEELALRDGEALQKWREYFEEDIEIEKVLQYFFILQWRSLKKYANTRGIRIFGDVPIFVAPDSADVWSRPELFQLDEENTPRVVSGVPPDYFSSTGQRWGNPLYNWEVHKEENFSWWKSRLKKSLELADVVRIDHFRGFEAYWEIPANSPTAVEGRWVKAPGEEFFTALSQELGELPVVAENLGVITHEVEELRRKFSLPGMLVLHFAFDPDGKGGIKADNPFLPHNHTSDAVVYTGTHDNNTTLGWYRSRSNEEKDLIRRYLGCADHEVVWELIREVYRSVARYSVVPLQDVLELGGEARMNVPSTVGSNWSWRATPGQLDYGKAGRLREYARLYGRDRSQSQNRGQSRSRAD
ncbi:MAG: 4-alpha-glucanotransferase [Spirochaetia bacterium]